MVEHDLAAPGAPSLVEHGITAQTFAGDLAPAEASHVIAQVERVLDAQVLVQNRATAAAEFVTKGKPMSKLSAVAERITAKKRAHDDIADHFAAQLNAIDAKEPGAFAIAEQVVSERASDLAQFESDMRQLSNLGN